MNQSLWWFQTSLQHKYGVVTLKKARVRRGSMAVRAIRFRHHQLDRRVCVCVCVSVSECVYVRESV